ncbi:VWA domain-containing protein [Candidatus Saccharibacteria bacterium]|nr:VWA domain-containing protein [Candidatus Saccharibacteria bacterium]
MTDEINYDALGQVAPNIDVGDIENDHMYLMGIAQDCSGSMDSYTPEMKKAIANFKQSIQDSKQDDEMLVSLTTFESNVQSSGYQNVADISTDFCARGCTSMYDAIILAANQLADYMDQLNNSGVRTRGGLVIFSDGYDNNSTRSASEAAKAIEDLKRKEVVVAFVAFGSDAHGIADSLGIDKQNVMETDASPSELRKIWGIISKSAISSSKSAAAGASQTTFFDV